MSAPVRTRVLGLLALVLVVALVPGLVLAALGYSDGATLVALGALTGLLACLMAGWRIALLAVVGLACATAVAIPVAGTPWAAATVVAAASAAVALTSQRGISAGLILAPITLAFTASDPPLDALGEPERAVVAAAGTLGAGLFAVAVTHLLHARLPEGDHASRSRAVTYAAMVSVLVWIATWIVQLNDLGHAGAWAVMTILLVVQPYLQDGSHIAVQRALGTVVGFAIALCFVLVSGVPILVYAAGGLFAYLALVFKLSGRPYWQFAAMLTPAVVLFEGAAGSLTTVAWERLVATLLAVLASLAAMLLVRPLYLAHAQRRGLDRW